MRQPALRTQEANGDRQRYRAAEGRQEASDGLPTRHPDHLAVEVWFEDGGAELFWRHELAREGDAPPLPPSAPDDAD